MKNSSSASVYAGFEQGPIRPPSEADSLLIRVSRNCPWNRCTFCPVYKGSAFSLRSTADVLRDIDAVANYVEEIRRMVADSGRLMPEQVVQLTAQGGDRCALNAALHWAAGGMRAIFLQDANSLVIKPENLLEILRHLQSSFPWVERITSYARSHSIARIAPELLAAMREAGLCRIHIGMESGSDEVLRQVRKGVDQATHIVAGRRVKEAGMELSEYVMPGLGGRRLSSLHATESAAALNAIDPDFIRLRSLAIPSHVELYQELQAGTFSKLSDVEVAAELRQFIAGLQGISSQLKSDHVLNLFEDLEGNLPEDQARMLALLDNFLQMPVEERVNYQVGRRIGLFRGLADMANDTAMARVREVRRRHAITALNVDEAIDAMMARFI